MGSSSSRFVGAHVLITGGSEGLGLALASEFLRQGARTVTLVARKLDKLEAARSLLLETMQGLESSSVQVEVADVTSYEEISQAIQRAKDKAGEVDVLVCNAGCSRPGYFHEMDLAVFEEQMRLNYMGSVNTAKAAYGGMVARNKWHICFVSSSMALMGFVGYTAYCPSKYAVRGLAECLRNEVQGTGVRISIAFPPDMKTPGFEVENRSKPKETATISDGSDGAFSSEKVAKKLVASIARGKFYLDNPDILLQIHAISVKGLVNRHFPRVLLEMLIGFIAPILHLVHTNTMDRISRSFAGERFQRVYDRT